MRDRSSAASAKENISSQIEVATLIALAHDSLDPTRDRIARDYLRHALAELESDARNLVTIQAD